MAPWGKKNKGIRASSMLQGLNFILTQKPPNKIVARKARWNEREERQDGGLLMMLLICVSRNSNCVRGCRRDYCMHRRRLSRAPLLPKTPAGWEACLLAARHRSRACVRVCVYKRGACLCVCWRCKVRDIVIIIVIVGLVMGVW